MIGITFGFTNGIITMLALITGLYVTKVNKIGIIGAILALLITDPLSDAYSMYSSQKLINEETAFTIGKKAFLSQVVLQLLFLIIIILSPNVKQGVIISYITGIILTIIYDRYKKVSIKESGKNLLIIFTLVTTIYYVNNLVYKYFKNY
jgi:hypothetical protein